MEKSCFLSRNTLLQWVNSLLQINLTHIQQLGSGSIYCHLLDAAYPNKVPLNRVKWSAVQQVEFIYNFKILQSSLQHLGIQKQINISKLTKAKFQDNFELLQWMYIYLSPNIYSSKREYNALQRRKGAKIDNNFLSNKSSIITKYSTHFKSTQNDKENCDSKQCRNLMAKSQTFETPSQSSKGDYRHQFFNNFKTVKSTANLLGFSSTKRFNSDIQLARKSNITKQNQVKSKKQAFSKYEGYFNKIVDFGQQNILSANKKLENVKSSFKQRKIKDFKKHCGPLKQINNFFSSTLKNEVNVAKAKEQQLQYF